MKNKIVAALLALFLGGLGIHQFYLGNNKKGIFYLLFFWTLIPAFIALIDFIFLITMSEDSFNSKYNKSLNANISNPQKDYNEYVRFTNEINLEDIEHGEHATSSYNDLLQKLIKDYRILTKEVDINKIKSNPIFRDFKTKELELNKINKTIGYPEVDYFDYLSSFLK